MKTTTFVIEAGWLIRGRVIEAITSAAWERGIECSHERVGKVIKFTLTGPELRIIALEVAIRQTFG